MIALARSRRCGGSCCRPAGAAARGRSMQWPSTASATATPCRALSTRSNMSSVRAVDLRHQRGAFVLARGERRAPSRRLRSRSPCAPSAMRAFVRLERRFRRLQPRRDLVGLQHVDEDQLLDARRPPPSPAAIWLLHRVVLVVGLHLHQLLFGLAQPLLGGEQILVDGAAGGLVVGQRLLGGGDGVARARSSLASSAAIALGRVGNASCAHPPPAFRSSWSWMRRSSSGSMAEVQSSKFKVQSSKSRSRSSKLQHFELERSTSEWAHLDSNQGPTDYEPAALTAELWAHRRFEPGTNRL